ncbi:biliverdin-producing heme oxygenase [Mariluticola halotolerans]|uniref:biliverdin-producing heme oxygenase n=1 Tax=Mariluticola halotolerans TaxID=2909283 RepID=UPI0026E3B72D|nr:biliverdin-producing heme oxygenase [Mariluticola halotolerans]UJQ95245.1 biliverdin-producing heme oxygenase [Mariluticola halotolerans]
MRIFPSKSVSIENIQRMNKMDYDASKIAARAHLAASVAGLHERLDRAMTLERMETVDDYRRHLRYHARVLVPLEKALQTNPHVSALPDAARRWRSAALLDDLRVLGESQPEKVETAIRVTLGAFAGAIYVLEGSRLGAKVLLRQLDAQADRDLPVAFLSHGADEKFWPSFVNWLNSREWSPSDLAEMRESAQAVFSAYLVACEHGA